MPTLWQKLRLYLIMVDKSYLEESEIINFSDSSLQSLAKNLSQNCNSDKEIAKNCFEYVLNEIHHSGDYKDEITTLKASDVLKYKTGWCYAKSHLLAALLRANKIPSGFCYQRLSCGEYKDNIYCLHGLNAVYLKDFGWYKIDARGNKKGVEAAFTPPFEKLAFELKEDEFDLATIYSKPLETVVETLQKNRSYEQMVNKLPLLDEFVRKAKVSDSEKLSLLTKSLTPFLFEEKLPKWFENELSVKSFEQRILSNEYQHFIYTKDNIILGFIAIKNKNHLYHLFVDKKYHKLGIANKLWESVKSNIDVSSMIVNASLYAIKVYEALGFEICDEEKQYLQLKFQPMKYKSHICK